MRLIERVPIIVPLAARVDGFHFAARSAEVTTELKALAFDHTYGISQRSVYQIKAANTNNLPQNAQHHEYHEVVYPRLVGDWRHYHENDTSRMDIIAERTGVYSGALEWSDKVARVLVALVLAARVLVALLLAGRA